MTRLVRNAALLTASGMLLASIALANVPDPSKSTLGVGLSANAKGSIRLSGVNNAGVTPTYVSSVGSHGVGITGGTTPSGYTVEIHDFANNPIAGSSVVADFSSCVPAAGGDIKISSNQRTFGTYVAPYKVAGSTNAAGRFTFFVVGSSNSTVLVGNAVPPGINCTGTGAGGCLNAGCARIYADGVLISGTALRVTAWDITGTGSPTDAVTGTDNAVLAAEFTKEGAVGVGSRQRSDLNRDGDVTGVDVALMSDVSVQPTTTAIADTSPYAP